MTLSEVLSVLGFLYISMGFLAFLYGFAAAVIDGYINRQK